MKNQLAAAFHVTLPYARKAEPWAVIGTSALVIVNHLTKNK